MSNLAQFVLLFVAMVVIAGWVNTHVDYAGNQCTAVLHEIADAVKDEY